MDDVERYADLNTYLWLQHIPTFVDEVGEAWTCVKCRTKHDIASYARHIRIHNWIQKASTEKEKGGSVNGKDIHINNVTKKEEDREAEKDAGGDEMDCRGRDEGGSASTGGGSVSVFFKTKKK
jgi:hypothetical protein